MNETKTYARDEEEIPVLQPSPISSLKLLKRKRCSHSTSATDSKDASDTDAGIADNMTSNSTCAVNNTITSANATNTNTATTTTTTTTTATTTMSTNPSTHNKNGHESTTTKQDTERKVYVFDVKEVPAYKPKNIKSKKVKVEKNYKHNQYLHDYITTKTKTTEFDYEYQQEEAEISTSSSLLSSSSSSSSLSSFSSASPSFDSSSSSASNKKRKMADRHQLPLWDIYCNTNIQNQSIVMKKIQSIIPPDLIAKSTNVSLLSSSSSSSSLYHDNENNKKYSKITFAIINFFLFCHERQQIWYKRKCNKSKPWTKDTILSSKHFTNLYRELDTGTVYFRRHVLELQREYNSRIQQVQQQQQQYEHQQQSHDNFNQIKDDFNLELLWSSICYRLVNRIQTFERIEGGIPKINEWKKYKRSFNKLYKQNYILFTGAHQSMGHKRYIETLSKLQGTNGNCKVLHNVMQRIKVASQKGDLMECTKAIQSVDNIGAFYAWQITCDLFECNVLGECVIDWVLLGPGSKTGLEYIFGNPSGWKDIELCKLLNDNQTYIFNCLGLNFVRFDNRTLSLKDIEHALCEFSKYVSGASGGNAESKMRIYRPGGSGATSPTTTCVKKSQLEQCCSECDRLILKGKNTSCYCDTCGNICCSDCVDYMGKDLISFICDECKDFSFYLQSRQKSYWM